MIPARLASTRLPRKVLREIAGLPLVVHVYHAARRSPRLDDLLVATDSDEVLATCRAHGIPAVMTSPDHPTGTDRLWEVSRGREADVYVNIQGDEPLVTAGHIERLVQPFFDDPSVQVTTLKILAKPEEVPTRTANKVVTNIHGDALYFSRLPIPCDRDNRGGRRLLEAPRLLRLPARGAGALPYSAAFPPRARRAARAAAAARARHPDSRRRDRRAHGGGGHRGRPPRGGSAARPPPPRPRFLSRRPAPS